MERTGRGCAAPPLRPPVTMHVASCRLEPVAPVRERGDRRDAEATIVVLGGTP